MLYKFVILKYKSRAGGYCESVIPDPFELGSQKAFQRRWYFVLRYGRVGRRRHFIKEFMKIKVYSNQ